MIRALALLRRLTPREPERCYLCRKHPAPDPSGMCDDCWREVSGNFGVGA